MVYGLSFIDFESYLITTTYKQFLSHTILIDVESIYRQFV